MNVVQRRDSEIMDQIALLRVVPPAHRFHLQADGLQCRLGLFNMGLHSAVRQREGEAVVKKDFHWLGKNGRKWN